MWFHHSAVNQNDNHVAWEESLKQEQMIFITTPLLIGLLLRDKIFGNFISQKLFHVTFYTIHLIKISFFFDFNFEFSGDNSTPTSMRKLQLGEIILTLADTRKWARTQLHDHVHARHFPHSHRITLQVLQKLYDTILSHP
jgi:hypothetical protein